MTLDHALVEDGTYFVAEHAGTLVACGGWGRRREYITPSGSGKQRCKLLDPPRDPVRVRAMYTHPEHARRGLGRLTLRHAKARRATPVSRMRNSSPLSQASPSTSRTAGTRSNAPPCPRASAWTYPRSGWASASWEASDLDPHGMPTRWYIPPPTRNRSHTHDRQLYSPMNPQAPEAAGQSRLEHQLTWSTCRTATASDARPCVAVEPAVLTVSRRNNCDRRQAHSWSAPGLDRSATMTFIAETITGLHRPRGHRRGPPRTAVSLLRARASRCAPRSDDIALGALTMIECPHSQGGAAARELRPQLSRRRNLRVPAQRRRLRSRVQHRRARVQMHDAALQSAAGRDLARRNRAHPHLGAW